MTTRNRTPECLLLCAIVMVLCVLINIPDAAEQKQPPPVSVKEKPAEPQSSWPLIWPDMKGTTSQIMVTRGSGIGWSRDRLVVLRFGKAVANIEREGGEFVFRGSYDDMCDVLQLHDFVLSRLSHPDRGKLLDRIEEVERELEATFREQGASDHVEK